MKIIDATTEHLPAILDILNQAIRTTTAVWSEEEDTLENRVQWMRITQAKNFPILVAIDDTSEAPTVLGYGAYGTFRSRSGYDVTVEHSVYIRPEAQGKGYGESLLKALIERATADPRLHRMIGAIDAANPASKKLHAKLGFETQGLLKGIAVKWGTPRDLLLMVKDVT